MRRLLIAACALACLSTIAPGQKDVEVVTVRGTVQDETGRPVSGARARLVLEPPDQQRLIFDRLLNHQPLPWARSDANGRFALALLPNHQYLGVLFSARMGLVVEKTGYQSWRENVPHALQLYAGSRVHLHKLRPSEHARVIVEDPAPDLRVRVRRFDNDDAGSGYGHLRPPEHVYEVPENGVVTVPVPVLPSPAVVPMGRDFAVLRHEVVLSWPGGRTAPRVIAAGQELRLRRTSVPGAEPVAETRQVRNETAGFGTVRFRVTDDGGQPIADALPTLAIPLPGGKLTYWIPPTPSHWFTDRDGIVEWDGVPAGQVFPHASKPGWMPRSEGSSAREVSPDRAIEVALQLERVVDYEIQVRDADGEPVPFAALVHEEWTDYPDGTSSGTSFHLRSDSRGVARARWPADSSLQVRMVDPRVHNQRGKLVPAGRSEITVRREPRVLLRTTPGQLLTSCSVPGGSHSDGRLIQLGGGILWRGMATVAFAVRDAPPVVWIAPADPEVHAEKPLLDVDRSRVVRRVPLAITGAGDIDLTGLRAVPVAVEGQRHMRALAGNMAMRDKAGAWSLGSRDGYAHDCILMHPAFLSLPVSIPRAEASGAADPVAVELVKGAPVVVRFSLRRKLHDLDRLELWVAYADVTSRLASGGPLYHGPLSLTSEQRKQRAFALPLPFALAPGAYEVQVQGVQGRVRKTVEIAGGSPAVVELGELHY